LEKEFLYIYILYKNIYTHLFFIGKSIILEVQLFKTINDRNKELTNQYIMELKVKLSGLVGDEFDCDGDFG
jgi:hypothetical protein